MSKNLLRTCAVLALITAVGCGDDSTSNNANKANNNPQPDMTTDMTTSPDQGSDMGGDMNAEPDMGGEVAAAKCTDTPKPPRCDADRATFNMWQPASVISKLELSDESCCFDYDGDGAPDNGLGAILTDLGPTLGFDVNRTIAENIADGSIAIVLEHDGLTSLAAGSTFAVNFLLADPVNTADPAPKIEGANAYLINPASFEAGVWPQARAEGAKIEAGNKVVAGPGRIVLRLDVLGIQLNLVISKARIEGEIDTANSDLATKGVAIKEGAKLGGLVRAADLFDAINTFQSSQCSCLTYSGDAMSKPPLITYTPADPADAACDAGYSAAGCDKNNEVESICKTLVDTACDYISAISIAFDVRADGRSCMGKDSTLPCDSASIGARIGAYGAKIEGVAAAGN
jgi:hypothetical protein